MNNVKTAVRVFQFEAAKVRTVTIGNEIWFVAKDVCNVLGLSNPRVAVSTLDEDEKGVRKVYTPGGTQETNIISESGLYALVIRSNKPNAKLIREATGIELGQNRFYNYLIDRGYLHKGGSQRGLPVQRCVETGILSIKIRIDGTIRRDVAQVTAKGLRYFIRRFNKDKEFLNFLYPEGFEK